MKIAVASPPYPKSPGKGLFWIEKQIKEAVRENAEIICFPESYIPGYPGIENQAITYSRDMLQLALEAVQRMAAEHSIAVILPMDWYLGEELFNLAHVISKTGKLLGYQTKNQLDPSEDHMWKAGTQRSIFEVNGLKFGITICHEGFRYPESVRWAARQDAKIVFHPHCTGNNKEGVLLTEWGNKSNPYYEKAMMMRAMENTIYYAGSNYAFLYPDSASSIIGPDGNCIVHGAYGKPEVVVADINMDLATGLLAKRFKNVLND